MGAKAKSIILLVCCILLCQIVGISSAALSNVSDRSWFYELNKPTWNPPGYLFAPVWTVLYLLMGISLWLILRATAVQKQKINALILFSVQLFLNFLWSILFFRFQLIVVAFADIILLDFLVIATMLSFYNIKKLAAWLLLPYLLWIVFASNLNYTIWVLN